MANPTYKFSNGLDLSRVLPKLTGRLKWISDGSSGSGRYFDDSSFHAMVNENVMKQSQNDDTITDFSSLKTQLETAAIMRSLNAVFNKEDVVEQTMLYEIAQSKMIAELQTAGFVGYKITLPADNDFSIKILNAVLHFNAAATFKIYVYEDGAVLPFWEQSVTTESDKYTIVSLTDCILSYASRKVSTFYVGYKPSEVLAHPYVRDFTCDLTTCIFGIEAVEGPLPIIGDRLVYSSNYKGLNLEAILPGLYLQSDERTGNDG